MGEKRRAFHFGGETVWLTLTELQGRLDGCLTKHVLAVWEDGGRKEEVEVEPQLPPYELKYFAGKRLDGFCFDFKTGVTRLTFENGCVEAKIISAELKQE